MKYKKKLIPLWNLWPPFLFSGIKIVKISKDFRYASTRLKLRWWNANYVGTQFGGSIFAMSDAMYMVLLLNILGPRYIVWDKAATIRYLKPGRTDLTAEFHVTDEDLAFIRSALEENEKIDWTKKVEIKDAKGVVVADVDRVLYIRKK